MDNFFIFCAQYLFIASFIVAAIVFFRLPRKTQIQVVVLGIICAGLSYGVALLAGQLYNDPRPFVEGHFKPLIAHDTENGFPSDHVLMLSVIAAVFGLFHKTSSLVLWLITLLVAYARVYTGVHHYIDVLASMLIVIMVTMIGYRLLKASILPAITIYINRVLQGFGLENQNQS